MTLPLIVGVDGSDASLGAADWAGREAVATGRDVRLLYVRPNDFWTRPGDERLAESEAYALHAMTRLAAELREAHPGLRVDVETVTGDPDLTLLRAADEAAAAASGRPGPEVRTDPRHGDRDNPGDLGRRISRRRRELGLSVADLAHRAGMAPSFLDWIETRPAEISFGEIARLAAGLRTSPQDLLGGRYRQRPGGSSATNQEP